MRVPTWLLATAVVGLAACSGGSSDAPLTTTVPVADTTPVTTAVTAEGEAAPSTTAAPEPVIVSMSVAVPEAGVDAELAGELSTSDGDPFGEFASCSGARREIGAYSVAISRPEGEIRSASLLTASRVLGSGTIDADVRLELADGTAIVAAGTATLDAGLRSGSFVAFDTDGRRVEGGFTCVAADGPAPLGLLDGPPVEVVALLRRDGPERVVGLASSDPAQVSCPGVIDGQPLVVRADGGPALGSLTTFELTVDGDAATLRLRIGDEVAEFRSVDVVLDEARLAGTFSAADDDLTVDGAFTCE